MLVLINDLTYKIVLLHTLRSNKICTFICVIICGNDEFYNTYLLYEVLEYYLIWSLRYTDTFICGDFKNELFNKLKICFVKLFQKIPLQLQL